MSALFDFRSFSRYLVAAVVYYSLPDLIGWRGMFVVGAIPAPLVLQAQIAASHGSNYGLALALVAGSVAIVLAILAWRGTEGRGRATHVSHPTVSSS